MPNRFEIALAEFRAKKKLEEKKEQEKELALIKKVISQLPQAPSIDEIASRVVVPTPKQEIIKEVHTKEIEVVKPLDRTEILQVVDEQFRKMVEMEENNNREILPEIKVIREEVDKSDLVTKKDLDEWLKKINNAILANTGGGGLAKVVEATTQERIDNLVSELTDLLKDISNNTESLTKLESLMDNLVYAMLDSKKQLVLMNARQEEAFDTKIKEEDV